ncbi:hypothetical protein GCM10025857_35070 [Alicyclobacillus contaminans]|uniref:deoxyribose-phosphate aldolase n=1 Tax=Alicyclobacillus contaminans TaxID=392016 RepID=UPI00042854BC|nr:deoxyribose-phosphate aldolase [Alicyclobacillus contaminans]GMA52150.1 hypothetical protein GCM10025857_35070 [Alicyclobacillus contaminans]
MRIERAAGGLVVRRTPAGPEVLLIDDSYGHVTFPKGHLEPGETWELAAIREIREETGVEARILAPLGRVEYRVERDGETIRKQVRLFLLEEIDETETPSPQLEEVRAAYFLPWDEARDKHDANGYANWRWVFEKADVLWRWHVAQWDKKWRQLAASTDADTLEQTWRSVQPLLSEMVRAVRRELTVVAPDIAAALSDVLSESGEEVVLPRTIANPLASLRDAIEHTLLKPEASAVDVESVCRAALDHHLRAVCINPQHVALAAEKLRGSSVIPCTVAGFPLGAAQPSALAAEVAAVAEDGAVEVDMVLPVGSMREDDIWTVHRHIAAAATAAHAHGARLKVIFETHFLTMAQVVMASLLSAAAGADFVKTSTGFAATGAQIADVAAMAVATEGKLGVKAAGGVRAQQEALNFLRFGATRIGTSSGPSLVRQ